MRLTWGTNDSNIWNYTIRYISYAQSYFGQYYGMFRTKTQYLVAVQLQSL